MAEAVAETVAEAEAVAVVIGETMLILKDFVWFIVVIFSLSACSSWRVVDKNSIQQDESKRSIRVKLVSGEIVESKNYEMKSDTLVIKKTRTPFYEGEERLIPLDQVQEIKIFKTSHESIAFGALLSALFVVLLIIAIDIGNSLSEIGN